MAGNPISKAAYKAAHFSTAYLNVPPNMHRLRNAVGLLVGLYAGRKLMDIVAGETIDGKKIDKNDLPPPLRPLHGILTYDHFSDKPKDRWMKVFDMSVPALLGGVGAGMGSMSFFRGTGADGKDLFLTQMDKRLKVPAKQFSLADAERETLYHQAKPAILASSHAAGYGSSGGLALMNPVGSPGSYSSTLGASFTWLSERTMVAAWLPKAWRAKLFNNYSLKPLRPTKLVQEIINELAGNPSLNPKNFEEDAEAVLKTWFHRATPHQIERFRNNILAQRNHWVQSAKAQGKTLEQVETEVKKHLTGFLNQADGSFEKRLIEAGIDPREAAIGNAGMFSNLARWGGDLFGFKTTAKLKATQTKLIEGLNARHPELSKWKTYIPADLTESSTAAKVVAGVTLGTGVATLGAIATAKDPGVADLKDADGDKASDKKFTDQVAAAAAPAGPRQHTVHSAKDRGFVNGKVLDTAEGITGMFNAGIGSHRVHCATGLMVGSWLGNQVMEAMTGRSFMGAHVPIEKVSRPLRKIYKTLAFNPHSDGQADKWVQVVRWGIPAIMGTLAVVQGSKMFFEKRHEHLKHAQTLDEVEDKATMAQSQPWSYTSAIVGLFGFPSGFPMLPLVNYSTNLGTRFSMGSGRKVSLPVVGKIWSNNSTLFPFGPPGMLNMMIEEAVNNKAYDPQLLETYAIGVLKPWFENVTPKQVEDFVMKVHEVRDQYFKEGGVPEDLKKELEKELRAHLKGAGLEKTLEEIGLDPTTAVIANNGLSGAIANTLGARGVIDKIKKDYVQSYRERLEKRRAQPDDTPSLPG